MNGTCPIGLIFRLAKVRGCMEGSQAPIPVPECFLLFKLSSKEAGC